ncbi:hypothetical protein [endosymbiont GvMRE of Glomus versiforme]|uniref:hypothetical protein n=1 Tax=endosymbiont GvMRE of Glomus versiforme TaxID=2039283 RepID=UPI000EDDED43|nr:hypothetical protein [endosymbiont GvMRE of Glomus versiforme]RHZ36552.1 HET domain protein [endosymbiont GvMRE of Glomus versiforme]
MENNKDWSDIHEDFAEINTDDDYEEDSYEYKTYQQIWEELGITYQEAQEWIQAGFKPKNIEKIQAWKSQNFPPQEAKRWIELGFSDHYYDVDKANSWKEQGFDFQQAKEWIQAGWDLDDSQKAKEWRDQGFTAQKSQEWIKVDFDSYDKYLIARKWNILGFTPQQTQEWLKVGLNKENAQFAKFLLNKGYTPNNSFPNEGKLNELKERYLKDTNDWSVIHEKFVEYQQEWEEKNFNLKEVQEWINIGLNPYDSLEAKRWKGKGFSPEQAKLWFNLDINKTDFGFADWLVKEKQLNPKRIKKKAIEELRNLYLSPWNEIDKDFEKYDYRQQWEEHNFTSEKTKEWIQVGIMKDEPDFVFYLIQQGYTPDTVDKNLLRNKIWLDWKYPSEIKKGIKELDISKEKLTGSLNFNDFVNLEKLDCSSNGFFNGTLNCLTYDGIDTLDISNCEKLVELNCSANFSLSNLSLPKKGEKLAKITNSCSDCGGTSNFLNDLSIFSHLENLEELDLGYNLLFAGSLEPLKNLTKLKHLDIYKTDIDSGLEYLSDSLEYFDCKNTKLEEIWELSWDQGDNNSRIRRWKTELPKKQIAARLIFNFWKAKKKYQQLKEDFQTRRQTIEITTQTELTSQNITQTQQQLTLLQQEQTQLQEAKQTAISQLEAQLSQTTTKYLQSQRQLTELQNQIFTLEQELTAKQALFQQLEQEKAEKETQLQTLQTLKPNAEEQAKISQLEKELTELSKKLKLETNIKGQLRKELEDKRNQIAELETELEEKDERLVSLKNKQQELVAVEKEFTKQLLQGKGSTAKIRKEKETKEQAMNEEMAKLEKELKVLKETLSQTLTSEARSQQLQTENTKLKEENQKLLNLYNNLWEQVVNKQETNQEAKIIQTQPFLGSSKGGNN